MRVTYTEPIQVTHGTNHHAFTSCARWYEDTYVAYREAQSHWPTPPGRIVIQHQRPGGTWGSTTVIASTDPATCDLRDPRLLATHDALYCLCGGYVPKYPATTISRRSAENYMQSFLTYTEDGATWAPLTPIFRPNYWLWSALPLTHFWVAAAYHTGVTGENSSIHLLIGDSLLTLRPHAIIYDGASMAKEQGGSGLRYTYPHALVAEPVLYQPTPDTLGCAVRSEDGDTCMELGVSRYPYQDWRWRHTRQKLHPSAIIETPYGFLLAGRELLKQQDTWSTFTTLYHLDGTTLTRLARLPSAHDTGYAGLCPGATNEEMLVSYYSQHATSTMYTTPLPGAHVFLSTLTVSPA